jgi:hypothetical protein
MNILSTINPTKHHILNSYIYSQSSFQERLAFETSNSTDINKRNFETAKRLEGLQKIIEGDCGHISRDKKL